MTYLITGIVGIVVGLAVLILSIYVKKSHNSKQKRCTAVVDGKLTSFAKKEFMRDDDTSNFSDVCYYPVYEYFVDGKRYEVQSSRAMKKADKTLLGQVKQICYNPKKCSESYVSGENIKIAFATMKIVSVIFFAIGVGSLLMYFLL